MTETLYANIVKVIEFYLGPVAPRFIDRQITSHFHKPPHDIAPEDIEQLTEWIKVSLALLTDNRDTVDECARKLNQLV